MKGGDPRCWPSLSYLGWTPKVGARASAYPAGHIQRTANQGAAAWPCRKTFPGGLGSPRSTQGSRSSTTGYCRSTSDRRVPMSSCMPDSPFFFFNVEMMTSTPSPSPGKALAPFRPAVGKVQETGGTHMSSSSEFLPRAVSHPCSSGHACISPKASPPISLLGGAWSASSVASLHSCPQASLLKSPHDSQVLSLSDGGTLLP